MKYTRNNDRLLYKNITLKINKLVWAQPPFSVFTLFHEQLYLEETEKTQLNKQTIILPFRELRVQSTTGISLSGVAGMYAAWDCH